MWRQWINVILGLLIISLPFSFFSVGSELTWTLSIMGAVIAALALWGALDRNNELSHRDDLRHRS